ncbi:MAG: hypothetical protein EHM93_05475 [Bacteroidales bacterium]|nr:MAG: hypothetical protein EHM93_05475 [Bacteroidales bacterium]
MAVFNKTSMVYDFYPSSFAINFNLYSPRIGTQRFSPIKIDSFNPYGASKPADIIFLGVANSFLRIVQK